MYKVRVHHSMNIKKFPPTWPLTNCVQYGKTCKDYKPKDQQAELEVEKGTLIKSMIPQKDFLVSFPRRVPLSALDCPISSDDMRTESNSTPTHSGVQLSG